MPRESGGMGFIGANFTNSQWIEVSRWHSATERRIREIVQGKYRQEQMHIL